MLGRDDMIDLAFLSPIPDEGHFFVGRALPRLRKRAAEDPCGGLNVKVADNNRRAMLERFRSPFEPLPCTGPQVGGFGFA